MIDMYAFCIEQVEWHKKQIDFCDSQIKFYTRELKRSRARDKELKQYALESRPDDPWTQKFYGGKYVSDETRKNINTRAQYYRERKYHIGRVEHYTKESEKYRRNA